jgi:hypothetical protein
VNTEIRFKSDRPDPVKPPKKRDSKFLRETLKAVAVFAIAAVIFYRLVLPAVAPTRHLTGNQSALAMCDWELTTWKSYQPRRHTFDFHQLTDDQKRRVVMFGLNQDFLIRTNFDWGTATNREIVIVCLREYDNVPVPAPWNLLYRNPAHAVGYSDGTTGLISPAEFANLFRYGYVSLWSLATNADFNIFKR